MNKKTRLPEHTEMFFETGSDGFYPSFCISIMGKKTIILINEYDVPLNKAYQAGYYGRLDSYI